jgi:hypothetical protein
MTRESKKTRKRQKDAFYRRYGTLHYDECFISTTDDFCPNYPGNLVKLKWLRLGSSPEDVKAGKPQLYRVNCWGADDLGLDLDSPDKEMIHQMYLNVIELQPIDIPGLLALGFNYF